MKAGKKKGCSVTRMWRNKQPDFALRLLCELQKQQQCSFHCDALLQTEGVSIPAHSCVMSALSPVFSRAFANAPSLPAGQSRLVQLEAVGAHALMKLVGFMYSGEIEGESLEEQQEVIDIACRLGFSNFIEEKHKQVKRYPNKTASWREIGLQTEETGGRKKDASIQILSKKPGFSHSGTQTDSTETLSADTCVASEPELSIGSPDELTDVSSQYNSISPDTGRAWIDEIVAHTPSNSSEALVRAHAKPRQTQKENKRAKITKKHGSTQLSLKIKLKRQRSGELWEIVSVQEEIAIDEPKTGGSSDDLPMMHSLAETHKSSVEVQLSPSPSLTCQNLETVTLTPPSELTTLLPSTPIVAPSDDFCFHAPDPVPRSSISQMQPLSPKLSQSGESNEHIAKMLGMVTVRLNISPSVTVEEYSSIPAHLDQKPEVCAAVANSPASNPCLPEHTLGAMETGTFKAREAGSGNQSGCEKWDLENAASVASNPTLFSRTSPCMMQKKNIDSSFTSPCPMTDIVPPKQTLGRKGLEHQNANELKTVINVFWGSDTYAQSGKQSVKNANEDWDIQTAAQSVWKSSDDGQAPNYDNCADFSEMRLPRCLSPLASETNITTYISTQDPLRPLEFSSCLSASHVNLEPALRYMSSPSQPQALPGETNQLSCPSQHVNELDCSGGKKNSYLLSSNRDRNGEVSECESEEKKTKMPDLENDLLKGTEDNTLDRRMNKSIVRDVSTAKHSLEADNEPCRKKAKMTGYPNEVKTSNKAISCNVRLKKLRHIESIQDISNPVIFETRNSVSIDQKSESQMSQASKCKDHDVCPKDAWDTKQPASLATKHKLERLLQKGTCAKAEMDSLSKDSELNSSLPVHNSSSSSHYDLQLTETSREFVPRDGNGRPTNVQHPPLGLVRNITKVKDVIVECENNSPEPEMKTPSVEPEKVTPDMNMNTEEYKQPTMYSSLAKERGFCDQIFHQTVFGVDTSVTQHLPINRQLRSNLQTADKQTRISLAPSLICEKISNHPETDHMSTEVIMVRNTQGKKYAAKESGTERGVPTIDQPGDVLNKFKDNKVDLKNSTYSQQCECSSKNGKGCLTNENFVRQIEFSGNTGLSIHEPVDLNATSHMSRIPPLRDLNNNYEMENNLQVTSTTLRHPSRFENMMETPKTGENIIRSLCKVPISNNPKGFNLIKTKDLHSEGTGSTRISNMERQEVWNTEKKKEKTEHGYISKINMYEAGRCDEVDVLDESAQLATGHGDEVIATGGNIDDDDDDEEESQITVEMDNDGQALAYEREIYGQQVSRTEDEVLPPEEGEKPDPSSSPVHTVSSSSAFLPDLSSESAEDSSSADEELVVDGTCDSPVQLCTVAGTRCNIILEEEDKWKEEEDDEEEEEEIDVTGEESN